MAKLRFIYPIETDKSQANYSIMKENQKTGSTVNGATIK